MSNNEGLIKNNEKNESKEKLMTRIKEENYYNYNVYWM